MGCLADLVGIEGSSADQPLLQIVHLAVQQMFQDVHHCLSRLKYYRGMKVEPAGLVACSAEKEPVAVVNFEVLVCFGLVDDQPAGTDLD